MARIMIAGKAMVVESAYTLGDIKKVEKYRPGALKLVDPETRDETFAVGTTVGRGSINKYGVSFSGTADANKACATLEIPDGVDDPAAYAEESIGQYLMNLIEVENALSGVLADIDATVADIRANITTL